LIWSCWWPSLIPNNAATAAADELDAIAVEASYSRRKQAKFSLFVG
jgi:hypothetical protein